MHLFEFGKPLIPVSEEKNLRPVPSKGGIKKTPVASQLKKCVNRLNGHGVRSIISKVQGQQTSKIGEINGAFQGLPLPF